MFTENIAKYKKKKIRMSGWAVKFVTFVKTLLLLCKTSTHVILLSFSLI